MFAPYPEHEITCPLCFSSFEPELDGGECVSCGNSYDISYRDGVRFISWSNDGDSHRPSFEVVHDSHPENCPNCSREYKKVLTQTERYFIIRKKCVCGTEDEEVVKR